MNVSWDELLQIVEAGSGFYERLQGDFVFGHTENLDNQLEKKLETWKENIAAGNEDQFLRRFAADGLELEQVYHIIQSAKWKERERGPEWIYLFRETIQVADKVQSKSHRFLDDNEPVPFAEFFIPFVYTSVQKLRNKVGKKYDCLSEDAYRQLERTLLERLSKIGSVTLQFEFKVYRLYQNLFGNVSNNKNSSFSIYRLFSKRMLEEKFFSFFKIYPVLAKLLSLTSMFWVEWISEFIQRFAQDKKEMEKLFNGNKEIGQILGVHTGLSDPHHRGRTVIISTFASGLRLVYKPRDPGIEEAYYQLLEYFNGQGQELPWKCLKVLNKQVYGWIEYVEQFPCVNEKQVQRYYIRCGMLLCLMSILGGTDFHCENIIASGEHPVPVDLEMLFQPYITDGTKISIDNRYDAIFRTGLLPPPQENWSGESSDLSGLTGGYNQKTSFKIPKWENINTDSMDYKMMHQMMEPAKNRNYLNSQLTTPYDYEEELISGFQKMYAFLVINRNQLLAKEGPLERFKGKRCRFVFRPTRVYTFFLYNTLFSHQLRDGMDRSIELDRLSKQFLTSDPNNALWPLLKEEHLSLEKMDIPYFSFETNGSALQISEHKEVENIFRPNAVTLVHDFIENLNPAFLNKGIESIKKILQANSFTGDLERGNEGPVMKKDLLDQAILIGEILQKKYLSSTPISRVVGFNLYAGSLGVAFFYAALAMITRQHNFRKQAFEEIHIFRKEFQGTRAVNYVNQYGIGGTTGLGSMVYALVRIHNFLGEQFILDEAIRTAKMITVDRISGDHIFDIMSGSAGAILGLIPLYKATGQEEILSQAVTCGKHLLNNRVKSDSGYTAWDNRLLKTIEGKLPTGFSHGAAGIAYALAQLFQVTDQIEFKHAAEEAIEYENSTYSPQKRNWADYRVSLMQAGHSPYFMETWCYGWPGIGLSRLGIESIWKTAVLERDIAIAVENAKDYQMKELDHLCCGNFGVIDLLLTAANQLAKEELYHLAVKQADLVLKRAKQQGDFRLDKQGSENQMGHSLFRGLAGIGYELLRLAAPKQLPSVLLLGVRLEKFPN